jgi:predicted  nucleic acid-binding Zn-ribbon protein
MAQSKGPLERLEQLEQQIITHDARIAELSKSGIHRVADWFVSGESIGKSIPRLETALAETMRRVVRLEDRLAAMTDNHTKLGGDFHGTKEEIEGFAETSTAALEMLTARIEKLEEDRSHGDQIGDGVNLRIDHVSMNSDNPDEWATTMVAAFDSYMRADVKRAKGAMLDALAKEHELRREQIGGRLETDDDLRARIIARIDEERDEPEQGQDEPLMTRAMAESIAKRAAQNWLRGGVDVPRYLFECGRPDWKPHAWVVDAVMAAARCQPAATQDRIELDAARSKIANLETHIRQYRSQVATQSDTIGALQNSEERTLAYMVLECKYNEAMLELEHAKKERADVQALRTALQAKHDQCRVVEEMHHNTQLQLDKFMGACADQTIQIMELRGERLRLEGKLAEQEKFTNEIMDEHRKTRRAFDEAASKHNSADQRAFALENWKTRLAKALGVRDDRHVIEAAVVRIVNGGPQQQLAIEREHHASEIANLMEQLRIADADRVPLRMDLDAAREEVKLMDGRLDRLQPIIRELDPWWLEVKARGGIPFPHERPLVSRYEAWKEAERAALRADDTDDDGFASAAANEGSRIAAEARAEREADSGNEG